MRTSVAKWIVALSMSITASVALASDMTLDPARLVGSKVKYSRTGKVLVYPAPVLAFKREGLASGPDEISEIKERIVYPLAIKSESPIATIVVELPSQDPTGVVVSVYWSDGSARESFISKAKDGHYDPRAYTVFFEKPTP